MVLWGKSQRNKLKIREALAMVNAILLAITLRQHVQADVRASFLNHARFPEAPWVENARRSAFVTVKKPKLPARRWPLHPGFISNIKGKYRTRDVTFYCLTVSVSDLQTHFNNGYAHTMGYKYIYINIYIYIYTYIHTHVYTCTYVYLCVCVHVCVSVYVCECVCVLSLAQGICQGCTARS